MLPHVIQVTRLSSTYTFHVDYDPPLAFWRVEAGQHVWPTPVRVTGRETVPDFFRRLAESAEREFHLNPASPL